MRRPGCALLACGPGTLLLLFKLVACLVVGGSRCEMKRDAWQPAIVCSPFTSPAAGKRRRQR